MVPSTPDNDNSSLEFQAAAAMDGLDRQDLVYTAVRAAGADEVSVVPVSSTFAYRRNGESAPSGASADPYALVRQALRGRYLQFAVLTLLGAAVGAAAGWKLGKPLFRGDGLVPIAHSTPSIGPHPTDHSSPLAQYDSVMRSQQQVLTSGPIVRKALGDPAWLALGRGATPDDVDDFTTELSAQWVSGTQHLRVSFDDPDPVAAAAGANAVIRAYVAAYRAGDIRFDEQRAQAIDRHVKEIESQIATADKQIRAVAEEYGLADINVMVEMATSTVRMLEAKGLDLDVAMAMASAAPAPATGP